MRKNIIFFLLTFVSFAACGFAEVEGERFQQSPEAVIAATHGHIDAKGLKALIESDISFALLDARGNKWHDSNIIPGAKMASYETSAEELAVMVPSVDDLICVYCYSFTCPLGRMLVSKLIEYGYTNIIEYPGGLSEWRDVAGYSVSNVIED